jgi:hypothetical protein
MKKNKILCRRRSSQEARAWGRWPPHHGGVGEGRTLEKENAGRILSRRRRPDLEPPPAASLVGRPHLETTPVLEHAPTTPDLEHGSPCRWVEKKEAAERILSRRRWPNLETSPPGSWDATPGPILRSGRGRRHRGSWGRSDLEWPLPARISRHGKRGKGRRCHGRSRVCPDLGRPLPARIPRRGRHRRRSRGRRHGERSRGRRHGERSRGRRRHGRWSRGRRRRGWGSMGLRRLGRRRGAAACGAVGGGGGGCGLRRHGRRRSGLRRAAPCEEEGGPTGGGRGGSVQEEVGEGAAGVG